MSISEIGESCNPDLFLETISHFEQISPIKTPELLQLAAKGSFVFISTISFFAAAGAAFPKKRKIILQTQTENGPQVQFFEVTEDSLQEPKSLTPYEKLRLTKEDETKIHFIVETLAQGAFSTTRNTGTLKQYDQELTPVHPLKFLETIFVKKLDQLQNIYKEKDGWLSSFLWKGFLGGVEKGFEKFIKEKGSVPDSYILPFCKILEVDPKPIEQSIQDKNWAALVQNLIDQVSSKKAT